MANRTDKFFPDGEWSEDAYQQHLAEEALRRWELENAPWRTAMREWLKKGGVFPAFIPRLAKRVCTLDRYCRDDLYRKEHGYAACVACPYGCGNYELFRELSEVFSEFQTGECCQQRGDYV